MGINSPCEGKDGMNRIKRILSKLIETIATSELRDISIGWASLCGTLAERQKSFSANAFQKTASPSRKDWKMLSDMKPSIQMQMKRKIKKRTVHEDSYRL